ncbi:lipoyl(octanoyl) transferase LipB [Tumebacillus flagellatus]|uniref:Octanoyltransferase n=1 Tax=Tumebacillus flagellatus TaxID=1157490 RepID=A0A074M8Q5_9BACL|nr:lipoyl(octanoyl) transferase LipB [Tumebacillus flagellatus]KEO82362.1 octanoyltransferase [Tumebacillus flagellatus]
MKPQCDIYDLGRVEYGQGFDLQKKAVRRMLKGELPNTALLLEHPPVYTIGRAGGAQNVLIGEEERKRLGIALFDVDRGGDVTYHGPGQLVGYPILHLRDWKNDVREYLRLLEEVIIRLLAGYGIEAGRKEGMTGAWVGNEKICAIGVKANRDTANQSYITSHGFALNVDPDLSHFGHIIPCGITEYGVTSLRKVLGRTVEMDEVKKRWVAAFAEVFGIETKQGEATADELAERWGEDVEV